MPDIDFHNQTWQKEPALHRSRPFLIIALAMMLLLLFALLSPPIAGSGSGHGSADAGPGNGNGRGNANNAPVSATTPDRAGTAVDQENHSVPADNSPTVATNAPGLTAILQELQNQSPIVPSLAAEKIQSASQATSAPGSRSGFLGVEVNAGKKMLFIVDTSGSMASQSPEHASRLDLMKEELITSIRQASHDPRKKYGGSFCIIAYASAVQAFPEEGRLRFSASDSLPKVERFVDALTASGGTDMLLAWETAEPLITGTEIQVVYFLSDGEVDDSIASELLTFLQRLPKKLVINTFSLGVSSELMRQIAGQHRGKYVEKL